MGQRKATHVKSGSVIIGEAADGYGTGIDPDPSNDDQEIYYFDDNPDWVVEDIKVPFEEQLAALGVGATIKLKALDNHNRVDYVKVSDVDDKPWAFVSRFESSYDSRAKRYANSEFSGDEWEILSEGYK
jgi:hypothetical protein